MERQIELGHPSVTVGGRGLAKTRHRLVEAGLTEVDWRRRWDAARLFLTADGESGAPYGNYTITLDPEDGSVTLVLPEPLRYLANAPRGRYRLACTVTFHHRRPEWLDRVSAHRAVRYDIVYDPARDRWYLDASWSTSTTAPPTPEEIQACGARLLAVDLNADHLAAIVLDPHGNPVGDPHIPLELTGPPLNGTGACERPSPASSSSLTSTAVRRSWWRISALPTPAPPAGRPWAAAVGARPSAALWPGFPPHASANGCGAWPTIRA
ncbi:hypothetical protein ACGF3G_12205 [Streptomyces sp. NPDC048179]|uniref:hypothetical protein n=1 Tax=Streptomyces sp. NPDC048179 TaxID=3365506 RepID=UPI0037217C84